MKKIILASAMFAATSTAALAQDEQGGFNGFHAGVIAGYDNVRLSDGVDSGSKGGIAYGVNAGYDANIGGAVIGIEAELTGSSVKQTENDVFVVGDAVSLKAGRDLYIGGRIGALVGSSTMVYAKAGYTDARVTASYTGGPGAGSASDNMGGYRLGAGIEQSFGVFSGRIEYRFSDYGEYNYAGTPSGLSAQRHQVVAGLSMRF